MKKWNILFALLLMTFVACNSDDKKDENTEPQEESKTEEQNDDALPSTGNFGKTITEDDAIALNDLFSQMNGQEELNLKITGTVETCCQKKGCWVTIVNENGDPLHVTFKDYGFFLPKDCAGKTAVMEGKAYWQTTPVDELKHYAEDAGQSADEIAMITEPKHELRFEAEGVIIK